MPCYKPVSAWQPLEADVNGKRPLVFGAQPSGDYQATEIACGQCIGCRLERSRQWAIRCVHEGNLYDDNCFITLTFSPEALAERDNPWSVDVRDFQLFMKRLRKRFCPKNPYSKKDEPELYNAFHNKHQIRFFHCGEYGEENFRPHYHACLFNFDFPDKVPYKNVDGYTLYTSEILEELWPYGFCTIGDLNFETAAYTARYIMKKVTGDAAKDHYVWIDDETGEVHPRNPEYVTMSRRPGIGYNWFNKFSSDVYSGDFVVMRGKKMRPPKFYDRKLEEDDELFFEIVKQQRQIDSAEFLDNNTDERLAVREELQQIKQNRVTRGL